MASRALTRTGGKAQPADWRAAFRRSLPTNPEQQRRSWYMYFFGTPFAEAAVQRDSLTFLDRLWRDWSRGGSTRPRSWIP